MTEAKIQLGFTSRLSDLMGRGISMRRAVRELESMSLADPRMQMLCAEVGRGLEEGRNISSVLASCSTVSFPRWYTVCIGAAEEKGCVGETLAFLSQTMQSRQKALSAFAGALVYPAIVVVLCFAASLWAACMYPTFFANDSLAYENGAAGAFLLSGLFLMCALFFSVFVLKLVTQPNPCVSLMHMLGFLTGKGASLRESLECAVSVVEKNERLCEAVMEIRERLLRGEPVEKAFPKLLEEAGFASAARIIASDVAFARLAGDCNVFERTAKALSQRTEKIRSRVLSCEQPVLLCCAAVYMLILLKNTLMPYLLGGGLGV